MSAAIAQDFPAEAPLTRRLALAEAHRPALLERSLFPSVSESLTSMLGIDVAYLPGSVVAAPWNGAALPPRSTWAIAHLVLHLEAEQRSAYLLTTLDMALDWGAAGIRLPPASRMPPVVASDGKVTLSDATEQCFLAYAEICNVMICGMMARTWRDQLRRPFFIMLDQVTPAVAAALPSVLADGAYIAVQGIFGLADRRAPASRGAAGPHQRLTPLVLVLPQDLAQPLLWPWSDSDGEAHRRLLEAGQWRGARP